MCFQRNCFLSLCSVLIPGLFMAGCCFDLTHVKQVPAKLSIADQPMPSLLLKENAAIPLESWSTTHLNANTVWIYVGTLEQGHVYRSKDQTVTVWGSNYYEGYPVIRDGMLYGFYLPVEKTFSAVSKPKPLVLSTVNPN